MQYLGLFTRPQAWAMFGCNRCEFTDEGNYDPAEVLFILRSHHWLRHGGRFPCNRTDLPVYG